MCVCVGVRACMCVGVRACMCVSVCAGFYPVGEGGEASTPKHSNCTVVQIAIEKALHEC